MDCHLLYVIIHFIMWCFMIAMFFCIIGIHGNRLTHLSLKSSDISDEGLRKLTSPLRICNTGLTKIKVLILAG